MVTANRFGFKPGDGAYNSQLLKEKMKENNAISEYAKENGIDFSVVRPGEAQEFVRNQNNNALNGVSDTTEKDFKGLGALDGTLVNQYIPQAQKLYSSLYSKSKEQQEKEDRMNTGMMMLNFFTKMGAEASRPGATALGSASVAGADTASMYIKQVNANRARRDAEKKGVVDLGVQMKKADDALTALKLKPKTFKSANRGDLVKYMNRADAEQYFLNYGMKKDNPNFNDSVSKLLAPRPELEGKYIKDSTGKQLELLPVYKGNEIVRFNLSAQPGAQVGMDYAGKLARIKQISLKVLPNLQKARLNLIPSAQTAMDILFRGETTGRFENTIQPFKEFFAGFFNLSQSDLVGKQLLETISNRLAPGMREAGSGPMSDKDLEVFKSAVLSLNNTPYANYISLYTFKRAKENMIKMVQTEQEMLQSDQNYSQEDINNKMGQLDTGIYKRFVNEGEDGKRLYDDKEQDEDGLTEEDRALNNFMGNLKDGDVVLNRDSFGKDLYSEKRTLMIIGGPDTFK